MVMVSNYTADLSPTVFQCMLFLYFYTSVPAELQQRKLSVCGAYAIYACVRMHVRLCLWALVRVRQVVCAPARLEACSVNTLISGEELFEVLMSYDYFAPQSNELPIACLLVCGAMYFIYIHAQTRFLTHYRCLIRA